MNENSEENFIHDIKVIKRKNGEYVVLLDKVPTNLLAQVLDICKGHDWLQIRMKPSDIERLDELGITDYEGLHIYYYCDTIAEAPINLLTRHGIAEVLIGAQENNCARKMDILKYSIIRYKLEKIVEDLNGKSQKEKFKIIYTRLAHMIDYDKDAIKDETQYAKENEETSRYVENAVLLNTAVCQGYCEVLKQTLSLVGIKAIICYSIEGQDEIRHTYNMVQLDGEWFNADLTWDYTNIRKGVSPKFCLKSNEDFLKCSEKDKPYHLPDDIQVPISTKSIELYPEFRGHSRKKVSRASSKKHRIMGIIRNVVRRKKNVKELEKLPAVKKDNFKEQIKAKTTYHSEEKTVSTAKHTYVKDDDILK